MTITLKNAIATGKLAHAYLFCGPRGVGKTTCARIFAKTINCQTPTAEGEACNQCESCLAFNEQRSYNIHELDAASNNSVEDIRSLIEQVRIPPQIGKYKVYIIDEVHMLSQAAFNAFLKTLEEPPHHAIFILATTEKHKILPTILSRCQIYDFNRIGIKDPQSEGGALLGTLPASNLTVVTSGTYERYFIADGKKYHHILDSETGYPTDTDVLSATIIAAKGRSVDCDGLSTTCLALGIENALALVNSIEGVEAILVDKDGKVYQTSEALNFAKA